tara:strand:- start:78 stop:689 length:612 start_codon:yes stop_codon:yes gene_type:complete
MPIKKDKKKDKKKGKDKKKIVKQKQAQKQSQSVVVNVIKEKVKRRRPVAKPVVATRFIQTFTTPQPPQFNAPITGGLVPNGQGQGIRLGGREPVAKAEFYEPIREAVALPFVEADSNIGRHIQEPLKPTPPTGDKKKAGRPRKYNTEEERRLAKLEASKRFRENKKREAEEKAIREAPNMIERRNLIDDEAITELQDYMKKTD